MPTLIPAPMQIAAAGNKPKIIQEFVGRVNSKTDGVSVARMQSPGGWIEPGQTPEFDEYVKVTDADVPGLSSRLTFAADGISVLETETFTAFALGVIVATVGVIYSIRARDRRSLYAAAAAAAVLVIGRLVLLGLDNALLGTVLLAGAGVLLLAGMTIFTIRRDAAADAVKRATSGLVDWD